MIITSCTPRILNTMLGRKKISTEGKNEHCSFGDYWSPLSKVFARYAKLFCVYMHGVQVLNPSCFTRFSMQPCALLRPCFLAFAAYCLDLRPAGSIIWYYAVYSISLYAYVQWTLICQCLQACETCPYVTRVLSISVWAGTAVSMTMTRSLHIHARLLACKSTRI